MTENENVVEETGVDEEIVIAETNDENVTANSPYQPIKDMAEKCGVEMPDMVATGDLTVENNKENVALVDDKPVKSVKKEVNKKIFLYLQWEQNLCLMVTNIKWFI